MYRLLLEILSTSNAVRIVYGRTSCSERTIKNLQVSMVSANANSGDDPGRDGCFRDVTGGLVPIVTGTDVLPHLPLYRLSPRLLELFLLSCYRCTCRNCLVPIVVTPDKGHTVESVGLFFTNGIGGTRL
jgi:hypothetical protein